MAGAGCASTSCAGVGFASTVSVDFAALHRQHPGALTVQLCIDGTCNTAQLQPADNTWSNSADPTTVRTRDIKVSITDARGKQIFSAGVQGPPTKVLFSPGQCDEQTAHSNAVIAGVDGTLTSAVVTPTVVSFNGR